MVIAKLNRERWKFSLLMISYVSFWEKKGKGQEPFRPVVATCMGE
jgi:hypothetical protein